MSWSRTKLSKRKAQERLRGKRSLRNRLNLNVMGREVDSGARLLEGRSPMNQDYDMALVMESKDSGDIWDEDV